MQTRIGHLGRGLTTASAALIVALGLGLRFEAPASAAPVEASAGVDHEPGETDGAREQATQEARRLALEQSLAGIRGDLRVDEGAVAAVLEHASAWTAGYRILSVDEGDGQLRVSVEVEIDLPRLRKRVAATSDGGEGRGFRWGSMRVVDCDSVDESVVREPLRAYGILGGEDAGETTLTVELRCTDRGLVSHTHVRAVAVEIVAKAEGEGLYEVRVDAQGFSSEIGEAQSVALDQALGALADELAVEARGALELHVETPWPSARLGVLESRLREAVIGVDRVELAGIAADGTAILRVGGSVELEGLGRQLQGLSFPGFGLVGLRVDSAHALRVRMQ